MQIDRPTSTEHAEFLALVDAEIRPHRANTRAQDDFPLILHDQNREWSLVAKTSEGEVVGGLATLIREFTTNFGNIPVAGIGSVVTARGFRGQGISRALQNALLEMLVGKKVPLAVLWTDQPEIYAGRGFLSAGWELHLDLGPADLAPRVPEGTAVRPVTAVDVRRVQQLYDRHPFRTIRRDQDPAQLYLMPGTNGFVLAAGGGDQWGASIQGAVFCGKGADFSTYIPEWDGDEAAVIPLLGHVRDAGLAQHLLIPAGEEKMAEKLVNLGAGWEIKNSGYWRVLDAAALATLTESPRSDEHNLPSDPRYWLGGVDDAGEVQPGVLKLGVWGFDSV